MTAITEVITALKQCTLTNCTFAQLEELRVALDAKAAELKATFMGQAEAMGLSCTDGKGKAPRRKRTATAEDPEV